MSQANAKERCGDGVRVASACDWGERESCESCPQDCGACEWTRARGDSPALAATLNAVWGSGPSDIFAVGGNGTILSYDVTSWMPSRADLRFDGTLFCPTLRNIGGTLTGEGYIVGSHGLILAQCPQGQCPVAPPPPPPRP